MGFKLFCSLIFFYCFCSGICLGCKKGPSCILPPKIVRQRKRSKVVVREDFKFMQNSGMKRSLVGIGDK